VFGVVLNRMIASGEFEVSGEIVRLAGSGDNMPELKRRQLQAIENMYAKAGLAAPLLSDVSKELRLAPEAMRELITLLLRSKRLVRMGADDAFVHPRALEKLYGDLRIHRGEMFDVGRFKSFTGLTRKHAIPLLEHLDQARVTRNNGGTRIIL
jgi:selenocysteine-specific elongation factor